MNTGPIRTARLDLLPLTPEALRAAIEGRMEDFARLFDLRAVPDWAPETPILAMRLAQLKAEPALQAWLLRLMRHRDSGRMLGHIGFHTAPGAAYLDDWLPGGVEFGIRVLAPYQRQGYAREAALALMDWAGQTQGIEDFLVSIGQDNHASQALFRMLGFRRIGTQQDDLDGPEDIYICRRPVAPGPTQPAT